MDVLYPTRLPITHTGTSSRSYGWLFLFLSSLFNLIFLPIGQLSCNASCASITRVASNRNLYPPFFTVSPIFGHWLPAGCNKKEVDRQKFSNPISITFCDDSAPFSCVCICLIYLKKKRWPSLQFPYWMSANEEEAATLLLTRLVAEKNGNSLTVGDLFIRCVSVDWTNYFLLSSLFSLFEKTHDHLFLWWGKVGDLLFNLHRSCGFLLNWSLERGVSRVAGPIQSAREKTPYKSREFNLMSTQSI